MTSVSTWFLEQNDCRARFAGIAGLYLFGEPVAAWAPRSHHPAWKVLLPIGGAAAVVLAGGTIVQGRGEYWSHRRPVTRRMSHPVMSRCSSTHG
ncbi:hypothetical protein [Tamaricihabitans halophyticus]|uniref:hypothetical protein n=1 Tax=Tamaricihabitans halophyticus TaxID=1262583 RepID=UPI001A9E8C8E|nr:hypothetical protein [Tamaricihabitans halophyticus]